jgi:hypothetical protein
MSRKLPLSLEKLIEEEEQEQVTTPAPPHPILVLARKSLGRWNLERECSGLQSWIQTTGTKKKIWLILQNGGGVRFEPLD